MSKDNLNRPLAPADKIFNNPKFPPHQRHTMHSFALRCEALLNQPRLCIRRLLRLLPTITGLLCLLPAVSPAAEYDAKVPVNAWVSMPPCFRTTYIGIHGGTVPVSLIASKDRTHMVALVGRTGNDFLQTLKYGTIESVSAPAETGGEPPTADPGETAVDKFGGQNAARVPFQYLAGNATILKAGTALGDMPVVYATGYSFAGLAELYADLLPFGLFEHSSLLEGTVKGPSKMKKAKSAKRRAPTPQ